MSAEQQPNDADSLRRYNIPEKYRLECLAKWRQAQRDGMKDAVVFMLDCRDEIGGIVARGRLPHAKTVMMTEKPPTPSEAPGIVAQAGHGASSHHIGVSPDAR